MGSILHEKRSLVHEFLGRNMSGPHPGLPPNGRAQFGGRGRAKSGGGSCPLFWLDDQVGKCEHAIFGRNVYGYPLEQCNIIDCVGKNKTGCVSSGR
jgi:hypothetical protein